MTTLPTNVRFSAMCIKTLFDVFKDNMTQQQLTSHLNRLPPNSSTDISSLVMYLTTCNNKNIIDLTLSASELKTAQKKRSREHQQQENVIRDDDDDHDEESEQKEEKGPAEDDSDDDDDDNDDDTTTDESDHHSIDPMSDDDDDVKEVEVFPKKYSRRPEQKSAKPSSQLTKQQSTWSDQMKHVSEAIKVMDGPMDITVRYSHAIIKNYVKPGMFISFRYPYVKASSHDKSTFMHNGYLMAYPTILVNNDNGTDVSPFPFYTLYTKCSNGTGEVIVVTRQCLPPDSFIEKHYNIDGKHNSNISRINNDGLRLAGPLRIRFFLCAPQLKVKENFNASLIHNWTAGSQLDGNTFFSGHYARLIHGFQLRPTINNTDDEEDLTARSKVYTVRVIGHKKCGLKLVNNACVHHSTNIPTNVTATSGAIDYDFNRQMLEYDLSRNALMTRATCCCFAEEFNQHLDEEDNSRNVFQDPVQHLFLPFMRCVHNPVVHSSYTYYDFDAKQAMNVAVVDALVLVNEALGRYDLEFGKIVAESLNTVRWNSLRSEGEFQIRAGTDKRLLRPIHFDLTQATRRVKQHRPDNSTDDEDNRNNVQRRIKSADDYHALSQRNPHYKYVEYQPWIGLTERQVMDECDVSAGPDNITLKTYQRASLEWMIFQESQSSLYEQLFQCYRLRPWRLAENKYHKDGGVTFEQNHESSPQGLRIMRIKEICNKVGSADLLGELRINYSSVSHLRKKKKHNPDGDADEEGSCGDDDDDDCDVGEDYDESIVELTEEQKQKKLKTQEAKLKKNGRQERLRKLALKPIECYRTGGMFSAVRRLGKTLTMAARISHRRKLALQNGDQKPFPTLIFANRKCITGPWRNTLATHTPHLKVLNMLDKAQRSANESSRKKLEGYDVILCSVSLLDKMPNAFLEADYESIVFDEAHTMSDSTSIRFRALACIHSNSFYQLTGTPYSGKNGPGHFGAFINLAWGMITQVSTYKNLIDNFEIANFNRFAQAGVVVVDSSDQEVQREIAERKFLCVIHYIDDSPFKAFQMHYRVMINAATRLKIMEQSYTQRDIQYLRRLRTFCSSRLDAMEHLNELFLKHKMQLEPFNPNQPEQHPLTSQYARHHMYEQRQQEQAQQQEQTSQSSSSNSSNVATLVTTGVPPSAILTMQAVLGGISSVDYDDLPIPRMFEPTDECPICLEIPFLSGNILIMQCNHAMCANCIYSWFHANSINLCPFDRYQNSLTSIRRLTFIKEHERLRLEQEQKEAERLRLLENNTTQSDSTDGSPVSRDLLHVTHSKVIRTASLNDKEWIPNDNLSLKYDSPNKHPKLAYLPKLLLDIHLNPASSKEKIVIFTSIQSTLETTYDYLSTFPEFEGKMLQLGSSGSVMRSEKVLKEFRNPQSEKFILIASLTTDAVGLDFSSADNCIYMEPQADKALEEQANDRLWNINRAANRPPMKVHYLVILNTIEETMIRMTPSKLQCEADTALIHESALYLETHLTSEKEKRAFRLRMMLADSSRKASPSNYVTMDHLNNASVANAVKQKKWSIDALILQSELKYRSALGR